MIKTKNLKALAKLANEADTRHYARGVYFEGKKKRAVFSDALMLVSVPADVPEDVKAIVTKPEAIKATKIAEATKSAEVSLDFETVDTIPGNFPPFVEAAYPKGLGLEVTVNITLLKKIVETLANTSTKDEHVTIKFDEDYPASRPVLFSNEQSVDCLLVPVRKRD